MPRIVGGAIKSGPRFDEFSRGARVGAVRGWCFLAKVHTISARSGNRALEGRRKAAWDVTAAGKFAQPYSPTRKASPSVDPDQQRAVGIVIEANGPLLGRTILGAGAAGDARAENEKYLARLLMGAGGLGLQGQ